MTLSTDDEGVSRTDLTAQYVKAVRQHGFGYRRLKQFATDGLLRLPHRGREEAALADQTALPEVQPLPWSMIATTRAGAALPPTSLSGKQATVKPVAGS